MVFCGVQVRILSTRRTSVDDCGRAGSTRGFESHLLRQASIGFNPRFINSLGSFDSRKYKTVVASRPDSQTVTLSPLDHDALFLRISLDSKTVASIPWIQF